MNNTTSIVLSQSGAPLVVPNGLADASSLSFVYTISGSPATLTITVEGLTNASGPSALLDSYSGTRDTTRSVNLASTYDAFRFTARWTGGTQSVSVGAAVTSTGVGPVFSSASLTAIQTSGGSGSGVPAGSDGQLQFNDSGAFGGSGYFYSASGFPTLSATAASDEMFIGTVPGGKVGLAAFNTGTAATIIMSYGSGNVDFAITDGTNALAFNSADGLFVSLSSSPTFQVLPSGNVGFFAASPSSQQTVTGAKADAVAASILAALVAYGLVVDGTT